MDPFHAGNIDSDLATLTECDPNARVYVRLTRDGDSWEVSYPDWDSAEAAVQKFNTDDYEGDSPIRANMLGIR